jgi:hypothetical protein
MTTDHLREAVAPPRLYVKAPAIQGKAKRQAEGRAQAEPLVPKARQAKDPQPLAEIPQLLRAVVAT